MNLVSYDFPTTKLIHFRRTAKFPGRKVAEKIAAEGCCRRSGTPQGQGFRFMPSTRLPRCRGQRSRYTGGACRRPGTSLRYARSPTALPPAGQELRYAPEAPCPDAVARGSVTHQGAPCPAACQQELRYAPGGGHCPAACPGLHYVTRRSPLSCRLPDKGFVTRRSPRPCCRTTKNFVTHQGATVLPPAGQGLRYTPEPTALPPANQEFRYAPGGALPCRRPGTSLRDCREATVLPPAHQELRYAPGGLTLPPAG